MFNLFLTIAATTTLGVVIKLSEGRAHERLAMLCANYITASTVSFIIWAQTGHPFALSKAAWAMAPIGGFIFAFNLFLMMLAVHKFGVALPVILMRLSAVVPISASVILFAEAPSAIQVAGVIGALAAAAMLSIGTEGGEMASHKGDISKPLMVVISIFILFCFGLADLIMKLFERLGVAGEKPLFLAFLFGCAAVITGAGLLIGRKRFPPGDFLWGVFLGVPNLLASYFIVSALSQLPAYIVFPAVSAGTVLLITLIAVGAFKEGFNRWGIIGFFLTLASITALNIR